jgi:hypothetical protein
MPYTKKPITGWQRLTLACGCTKDRTIRDNQGYFVHEDLWCTTMGPGGFDHGLVIIAKVEELSGKDVVRRSRVDYDLEFVFFRNGSVGIQARGSYRPITAEQWADITGKS